MKRGLVVLDHTELPEAEWRRRIDAVRGRLAADGVQLGLVYGDVFRSDDIAYLTNLCIYWNEGLLAVPADGEPALLTKLSPRVHSWMRRTSTLTDLRSGRTFGALVAALLTDRAPGTLGLIEADLWPAALVDEVSAAAPGWRVRRLDGLVRELRRQPSAPEVALLRTAGATLTEAITAATASGLSDRERVSVAERIVRTAGFTDVVVRATGASVEITGQHRNNWLRVARAFDAEVGAALRAVVAAAADGGTAGALRTAAKAGLAGAHLAWDVRVVDHADLSTNGEYAGQAADPALRAGQVVVLSVAAVSPDGAEHTAAATVLITASGAEPLAE